MVKLPKLDNDLIQLGKKIKNVKIKWNDEKEIQFINDKKKAMYNFHSYGLTPNYYDCGFSKYTQKVLNDNDVKRLRVYFCKYLEKSP